MQLGTAVAALALALSCTKREPAPQQTAAAPVPHASTRPQDDRRWQARRERLVQQLAEDGIQDGRVLAALRRVPRHLFVPKESRELAYVDEPLSIGFGQTISQPAVVAEMSESARIQATDNCLEIGTGSGYQAAVLAELCNSVRSIEYLPKVAQLGASNLRQAGYVSRVQLRVGDGYRGWPEAAPYDVIIVTAAPERVPPPLLQQLKVGGRLVIPVGPAHDQWLERYTRQAPGSGSGALRRERTTPVRFVPFLGNASE
jgi:protein-L-isoaspartate(D-aspartate) O-methyltransferase